jgi:hypothetical protein
MSSSSFTEIQLGNFLTINNNNIDLNGSVLVNSGSAVNGNDIPTKSYVDNAVSTAISIVNNKFGEQKQRLDAISLTCNHRYAEQNQTINDFSTTCNNRDAEQNQRIDNISLTAGNNDADGNNHQAIIKMINDEITRAKQVEETLIVNYNMLHQQFNDFHIDSNLINQLNAEIARAHLAEDALNAKCFILQQQLNKLHTYFFGTNASVPPSR